MVGEKGDSENSVRESVASSLDHLHKNLQSILIDMSKRALTASVLDMPRGTELRGPALKQMALNRPFIGSLQSAEELAFLNKNLAFEQFVASHGASSHRKGIIGEIITRLKNSFNTALRSLFLSGYLDAERVFTENLVRHLNATGRYIDAQYSEIFRHFHDEVARLEDEIRGVETGNKQSLADIIQSTLSHLEALQDKLNGVKLSDSAISSQSSDRDRESNGSE
jgi:hypothetical protein